MKTQWRDSILVLIAILLCSWAGFRWLSRSGKATYRNRTAYQWLVLASRPGAAPRDLVDFPEAIQTLNTDFLQVMVDCPASGFTGRFGPWLQALYKRSPKAMRRFFPQPLTRFAVRNCAGIFIAELGRDNCVTYLKTALRTGTDENQSYISELIYSFAAGNPVEAKNHLQAPELCVRLQAALYLQSFGSSQSSIQSAASAIPVLVMALTNSAQMAETYGDHANFWRKAARQELQRLSPEAAARYTN